MTITLGKIAAKARIRYEGFDTLVGFLYKVYEKEGMDAMTKSLLDIENQYVRTKVKNYIVKQDWQSPLSREELTYLALLDT